MVNRLSIASFELFRVNKIKKKGKITHTPLEIVK